MGLPSEGPLVHPGLSMPARRLGRDVTCYPNILRLGCMVVVPAPMVRLPDSHVYAL